MQISFFKFSILSSAILSCSAFAQQAVETSQQLETIVVTAEEQVKQSLGVSIITEQDLEKLPVTNDISEYVRRMPGVNLTGNSVGGARGNNRQIDIRGMGPENTLILIDGRPVTSRNSVRYSWSGERDTRGDSNWVPSDAIESIEVLRGPAAARYGSGAMGGVVNIKTKKITNELHGSVEMYSNQPENGKEGNTNRISATVSGPMIQDKLSYRVYSNFNKTDADAVDLNPLTASGTRAAGREGVENTDGGLRLAWQVAPNQTLVFDGAYSKQSNIFAGDTQNNNYDASSTSSVANARLNSLIGEETNRMLRESYALTHEGDWGWATSKILTSFDKTKNTRYNEGLAGGPEGSINSLDKSTSVLETTRLNGELNIPVQWGVPQVLTLGAEWVRDDFNDTASTSQNTVVGAESLVDLPENRGRMKSEIYSAYVEDNISVNDKTNVVLALRYDHHSKSGSNLSPAINVTYRFNDYWTLKGGVARAYKAPNLYQNAEGYLLYTNGNGCPLTYTLNGTTYTTTGASGNPLTLSGCYLQGTEDLKPEKSINSELGIQFNNDKVNASLTWFRNDYKDKIASGDVIIGQVTANNRTYNLLKWENIPEALIQGIEGSVALNYDNATWTNNITYMMDSENKQTGNALSIIPVYTWNSIFNYTVNDKVDVNFVYTQYGRQKPRQFAENNTQSSARSGLNTTSVKSYGIAGINVGYRFNDQLSARLGISNLFDEQILRDNTVNQTYNEPGRAYYMNLKYTF